MKITPRLLEVLNNAADINCGIIIPEGDRIKIRNGAFSVVADLKIDVAAPRKFAIYDLPMFLSAIAIFSGNDVSLEDISAEALVIKSSSGSSIKYFLADEALVTPAPAVSDKFPAVVATCTITPDVLRDLQKSSGVFKTPVFKITSEGMIESCDPKNPTAKHIRIPINISATDQKVIAFEAHYAINNLRLIKDTYKFEITTGGITRVSNESGDNVYYIANEKTSKFLS